MPIKTGLDCVPMHDHYAIITTSSRTTTTAGDERSRTHPGHGYPERTETIVSTDYQAFDDVEEWKAEIGRMLRLNRPYRALQVNVATISHHVSADFSKTY